MPEHAYTVQDTPRVRERISSDLATAVDRVREADPHLRSFVLTGGFARGEGTVVDGQPQNDYDFVAVRGLGRTREPYEGVAAELEDELGLHIDLAPVLVYRLPWVASSIFWYETALRGQILWGEDLLDRIPVREQADVDATEALRLLANRAAGLLLVRRDEDAHAHRIQAAKALLAALDAHLFAQGAFEPSQTERWERYRSTDRHGLDLSALDELEPWLSWAFDFKTNPASVDPQDPLEAWQAAAGAVLAAVPAALDRAGLASLDAYRSTDGFLDHAHYALEAASIPGAEAFARHPTGTVRVGTFRLLEASRDGTIDHEAARQHLGSMADIRGDPLGTLETLRGATLQ